MQLPCADTVSRIEDFINPDNCEIRLSNPSIPSDGRFCMPAQEPRSAKPATSKGDLVATQRGAGVRTDLVLAQPAISRNLCPL